MDRQIRKKEFLLRSYVHTSETEKKTLHEIPSRKNIIGMIGILMILVIVSITCLFLAKQFLYMKDSLFYGLLLFSILIGIWRFCMLKMTLLEVSKHSLMIKYTHPFKEIKQAPPVLEIPMNKLDSYTIIKEFFVYYLVINRRSERGNGVKNFYFRLGFLTEKQIKSIRETLNTIQTTQNQ